MCSSDLTTFINENPEEAAELIAAEINIEPEDCLRIMGNNVYSMAFDKQFMEGTNTMAAFMVDMDNISAIPDFDSYTATDLLSAINPDLVTIP